MRDRIMSAVCVSKLHRQGCRFVPRLTGEGPFKDVYSVMAAWGANHGAVSYGHIGADLITLASMRAS